MTISLTTFGFKNGLPGESDMVFDVRFLPNPHFVPKLRKLTGRTCQSGKVHPAVSRRPRSFWIR